MWRCSKNSQFLFETLLGAKIGDMTKICDIEYVIFPQQIMHKLCNFFYE
jgi:hypothetical protein